MKMMLSVWRGVLFLAFLWTAPVNAQAWMTAECTIQNGERITVFISQGSARIAYGKEKPHMAFPEYKDGVMSVVHIGATASFILSMTISTGRSFGIMVTEKGERYEYNAICKINAGEL
jgi:hypothetical protein